jgi:hypothetical protein
MPKITKLTTRRIGPFGVAFTAWDVWRRLSPQQRRWVTAQVRQHGPAIAQKAIRAQRRRRP